MTRAYQLINAKRVDMLIVDREYWPVAAVEYQGSGHHLGNAAQRDAIKREALRKAGIDFLEVCEGDTAAMLRDRLRHLAERRGVAPPEIMRAAGERVAQTPMAAPHPA